MTLPQLTFFLFMTGGALGISACFVGKGKRAAVLAAAGVVLALIAVLIMLAFPKAF